MEFYNTDLTMNTVETHDLKHKWNLWGHLPQDPDWTLKSYKHISQFKTVEDAIAITETLPPDLVKACMLFVMRDGVSPMWEDPKNRNGGCFSYKISNKYVWDLGEKLHMLL